MVSHVGTQNLGDEAIFAAATLEIRDRYPDAEIIGFTFNPADTRERHGIPSFPVRHGITSLRIGRGERAVEGSRLSKLAWLTTYIKAATKAAPRLHAVLRTLLRSARLLWGAPQELRFVARCYARLKGIDLLIVTGGNQLNDYFGGPWGFPYDLLIWCVLAKCRRAKVAFLCCGAGPLDSWLGKLFIRCSLSWADSRSYRDEFSRRLIERIGVSRPDPVCTDLAYGLRPVRTTEPEPAGSRLMVGISPLPYFDERYWPEQSVAVYRRYIRQLADFAIWLHERGHTAVFFPTQLHADPPVIQDIRALLKGSAAASVEPPPVDRPISSLDDLLRSISLMDIVVATRYHGILLSSVLHKPVLAIAYYEKTRDLMAQIGQADCVLDINSLDATSLAEQFVAVESRTDAIRRKIEQRTWALRRSLGREYDRVFGLLGDASSLGVANERVAALARVQG